MVTYDIIHCNLEKRQLITKYKMDVGQRLPKHYEISCVFYILAVYDAFSFILIKLVLSSDIWRRCHFWRQRLSKQIYKHLLGTIEV